MRAKPSADYEGLVTGGTCGLKRARGMSDAAEAMTTRPVLRSTAMTDQVAKALDGRASNRHRQTIVRPSVRRIGSSSGRMALVNTSFDEP